MLEAQDVRFSIQQKEILHGVSATFQPGSFAVIVGPNGSGKSTLLRLLSGERSATSGTVTYGGIPVKTIGPRALSRVRGVLSQQNDLLFPLTVLEVVLMGRYPHFGMKPGTADFEIANAALERVGVASFADRNYLTLSGGEQQSVQFARVLAQLWPTAETNQRYLLLDEPTTFLDLRHQHTLLNLSREVAREGAVVVGVLHDINLAAQYADYLIAMKDGAVFVQGTLADVLRADVLSELFDTSVSLLEAPGQPHPFVYVG